MAAANTPNPAPDQVPPAQIEAKAETIAVGKAQMALRQLIPLAIAAGFFIGLGGLYFTLFMSDAAMGFAASRFAGGVVFSLGLALVVICGAELFTGNALMVAAALSRKITGGQMLANWFWVWVFNFVGALILVFLVYFANAQSLGNLGTAMMRIAVGKMTQPWVTLFFKGILCNVLVCLGVWVAFASRTVVDKAVGVILPVSAFVALGFEHCVANMYFLPMGLVLALTGFPVPQGVDASVFTLGSMLFNLSAVTLGNIAGGAMIGIVYWFAFGRKAG
ncbi:MAG TPA: formate transporter FocA [Sutterella sp.]|nr:formate transporter FocA [Sutterella sp.]